VILGAVRGVVITRNARQMCVSFTKAISFLRQVMWLLTLTGKEKSWFGFKISFVETLMGLGEIYHRVVVRCGLLVERHGVAGWARLPAIDELQIIHIVADRRHVARSSGKSSPPQWSDACDCSKLPLLATLYATTYILPNTSESNPKICRSLYTERTRFQGKLPLIRVRSWMNRLKSNEEADSVYILSGWRLKTNIRKFNTSLVCVVIILVPGFKGWRSVVSNLLLSTETTKKQNTIPLVRRIIESKYKRRFLLLCWA